VAAVIACAQAFNDGEVNWAQAWSNMKAIGNGVPAQALGSHPHDFMKQWWVSFITTGNVEDAERSGRPPLIPDEEAAEAAELVKEGQWVWRQPKSQGIKTHVLFSSIPAAIRAVPRLAQICRDHNATSDQLRSAMERVDSDLTRRTLHFKFAHSAEQLEERQSFCQQTLASMDEMPAARVAELDNMVWWDEGGVAVSALEHRSVRVWGSRAAMHSFDVLHLPSVQGQADCKIHFAIAVTSHPAFSNCNGLLYFEFTTGTTCMRRLHNKLVEDGDEEHEYRVSKQVVTYPVAKCIVPHMAVHVYCLQQFCHMHVCFEHVALSKHHTLLSTCNINSSKHRWRL
jgi:hypothetical protein